MAAKPPFVAPVGSSVKKPTQQPRVADDGGSRFRQLQIEGDSDSDDEEDDDTSEEETFEENRRKSEENDRKSKKIEESGRKLQENGRKLEDNVVHIIETRHVSKNVHINQTEMKQRKENNHGLSFDKQSNKENNHGVSFDNSTLNAREPEQFDNAKSSDLSTTNLSEEDVKSQCSIFETLEANYKLAISKESISPVH